MPPHPAKCPTLIAGVLCIALKTGCSVSIPLQTGPIHDGKTLGVNGFDGQFSVTRAVTSRYSLSTLAWYAIPDPQITVDRSDDILMSASARYGIISGLDVGAETHSNISSFGGQVFLKSRVYDGDWPISAAAVLSLGYDKGSISGGEGTAYAESSTRLRAHAVQFAGGIPLSYAFSPYTVLSGSAFLHYASLEASGEFTSSDKFGTYRGKRFASTRIAAISYTLGLNIIGVGVFVRWYDGEQPMWGFSLGPDLYSIFSD